VVGILGYDKIYITAKHFAVRFAMIESVDLFSGSEDTRVKGFYDALMLWTECPVIGCGTTRFIERQQKMINTSDHNYYSRLLASRGLVGLIPFVVFILLLQMTLSSNKWKVEQSLKPMEHALGAGMVALIINLNMFVPGELFHVWIWFALTGAWIRVSSQYRKKGSIISSEAREGIHAVPA
jgi:O-antigen ligase